MKKRFLHFYDKIIIAFILGILALFGCARKTYSEKRQEKSEVKKDTIQSADSLKIIKDGFDNRVIAMYGVRPTRNID